MERSRSRTSTIDRIQMNQMPKINNANPEQDAVKSLISCIKDTKKLGHTNDIQEMFDVAEGLLDAVTDFIYHRIYLVDEAGRLEPDREMCPDSLHVEAEILEWSFQNAEPSLIPVDAVEYEDVRSVIVLPLVYRNERLGVIALWVGFAEDVFSQLKRAALLIVSMEISSVLMKLNLNQKIKDSQSMLSNILEDIPHAVFSIDQDGRITVINSNVEVLFNVKKADVLEKPYFEVIPENVSNIIQTLINSIRNTIRHEAEQEIEFELNDRTTIYLGITVSVMKSWKGDANGYVILCRNLEMSRELAKLREVDAMKDDFISLVSHELRTPLSSIISYSEALLTEDMIDSEEERVEFLNVILSEGNRLARLITDILDLSKAESGKMEYMFQQNDINAIIKRCIGSVSAKANEKEIDIVPELAAGLPRVRCDNDRIMQVVINIFSNALKFTPNRGRITVRSLYMKNTGSGKGGVRICIRDTGIGIAKENIDKVFSKFEQIESMENHSAGTGLGMAICREIVETGHGGRIWLESELEKGTEFFVELPE